MVKNIVILGAGFAGIRVVQDLAKKIKNLPYSIILVDKESAHIFKSDLFEVATAFNKKISEKALTKLKETVATPIKKLVPEGVLFIQDEILRLDYAKKKVVLKKGGDLNYHYLVVALGSDVNYFGIPGLKKNAFQMKNIQDGVKFNVYLDQFFRQFWLDGKERNVNLVIGGGGATGVEMACELVGALRLLCKKYKFPRQKVMITLIEGSGKLIGLDKGETELVLRRLRKLGIRVLLNTLIKKVEKKELQIGEKKMAYDILVWTGGIKVNPLVGEAILVNKFLQAEKYKNVFALGDNAYFPDPKNKGKRLPMLASIAVEQGTCAARNIFALIRYDKMEKFVHGTTQMIVPLGGKYAIWKSGDRLFKGFWVWGLKRLVYLKYVLSILPFWKALKKWLHSSKVFIEND